MGFLSGLAFVIVAILYHAVYEFDVFWWKHFARHTLNDEEKSYNSKIEAICSVLDEHYLKLLNDNNNLLMKTSMPYSEAKLVLNAQFEALKMTDTEKIRAMRGVNGQHARNSSKMFGEYEFALGGRSECFLLQTFLRETKYTPPPKPINDFWK